MFGDRRCDVHVAHRSYRQHNVFGVVCPYDTDMSLSRCKHAHCLGYLDSPLGAVHIGARDATPVRVTPFRVTHMNTLVPLIVRAIMVIFWSPVSGGYPRVHFVDAR